MSLLLLLSMTQGDVSRLWEDASVTGEQTIFKSVLDVDGTSRTKKKKNPSSAALRPWGPEALLVRLLSYVRGVVA